MIGVNSLEPVIGAMEHPLGLNLAGHGKEAGCDGCLVGIEHSKFSADPKLWRFETLVVWVQQELPLKTPKQRTCIAGSVGLSA